MATFGGATPRLRLIYLLKQTGTAGVARQQLHFLCVDKENGSKRKRPEALIIMVKQYEPHCVTIIIALSQKD